MSIVSSTGIVEVNVGGHVFSTTVDTLEAAGDSFFSSMISGDFGVHKDSKGLPFIDRDPKLFRHVLNYLRSQCTSLTLEHESKAKLAALIVEAEFYQVSPLLNELQMRMAAMNRGEAAAAEREAKAERDAAEMRCRGRSRGREVSRGMARAISFSGSNVADEGEVLSQAATDGGYESESSGDDGDGEHNTPLSQGRYVETAHADLISTAASNMDADF